MLESPKQYSGRSKRKGRNETTFIAPEKKLCIFIKKEQKYSSTKNIHVGGRKEFVHAHKGHEKIPKIFAYILGGGVKKFTKKRIFQFSQQA